MGQICTQRGELEDALQWVESLPDYATRTTVLSEILIRIGKHTKAETLLLESIEKHCTHRMGYTIWYTKLIRCAMLEEQNAKAWRYVQKGLTYGDAAAYAWVTMHILAEVLALYLAENDYTGAIYLLSLIMHHPSSSGRVRARVKPLQEQLAMKFSVQDYEAAWERGKQLDLGDVITDLMER